MKSRKLHKHATKLLALVLSMLMLLGAMPVAFAAATKPTIIEKPTLAEGTEIVVGQKYKNFELIGGKADVPGHFEYAFPENTPYAVNNGKVAVQVTFIPDDTVNYLSLNTVFLTSGRKADCPTMEGAAVAFVTAGKALSEAVITPSDDFGIKSYDTLFKTKITWENPDKVMDTAGVYTEKATVTALAGNGNPMKETAIDTFTIDVQVAVDSGTEAVELKELPTASVITTNQYVSDSVLTGGRVTKGGKDVAGTFEWKNPPDWKLLEGTYNQTVVFTPDNFTVCAPIEMLVVVTVANAIPDAEIKEFPTASTIKLGQTLADSKLTGGVVTKNGVEIPGTFAWKDGTIAPNAGTWDFTAVFTPTDPAACDPIEIKVAVTVEKLDVEITWAEEVTATYVYNSFVEYYVNLGDGFTANIPGNFIVSKANTHQMKSINDTFNVTVQFIPEDKTNYETVSKEIPVKLVPDNPKCTVEGYMDTMGGDNRKLAHWGAYIQNKYNMEQATGTLYVVLDGEKTAVTLPGESFKSTELTPGEHTVYSEYIPGENDVYEYDKSNEEIFVVPTFYTLTINDGANTTTKEFLPGDGVWIEAAPNEKTYYDFTGWTVEGNLAEYRQTDLTQKRTIIKLTDGDVTVTANYKFNFKNFVKYVFEQIGVKLMALIQQGIEWIKGIRP